MAKEKNAVANPFVRELFQFGVYKRSQGRITRQVTFLAVVVLLGLGAWRLGLYLQLTLNQQGAMPVVVPVLIAVIGAWITYRLVNLPSFADFLIAVEAEMNKVSWPSRAELIRSSLVVILLIVFMVGILYAYDVFWRALLDVIGVVRFTR